MEYKLIMENWRKHLNELDVDPVSGTTDMANAPYTSRALTTDQRLKYNKTQRELAKGNIAPDVAKIFAEAAIIMAKEIALFLEPTGQISDVNIKDGSIRYTYQDLMDSAASAELNFKKGNYLTAGFDSFLAVLAALAMIPILGKLFRGTRKAARFARLVDKTVDGADTASKALRRTGHTDLVAKANKIDSVAAKTSNGKATAVSGAAKTASKFFRSRMVRDHQGRLLVVMYTSKGPVVFLKSSGTSQIKILGFSGGKPVFASNDRSWVPIEGFGRGMYQKFDSSDVRFGKGAESNKQLYELVDGGDASEFMMDKHGFDWPRKIDMRELDKFDPRALKDLEKMYEKYPNEFYRIREGGKYPSPDSEFGRLSKHLQNLEDDNQLISTFGEIEQLELNDMFEWVNNNMGNTKQ